MEVEKKLDVIEVPSILNENAKETKWIKDTVEFTKKCDACGAVMRGWAYREPFKFCPKCGAVAEKAE